MASGAPVASRALTARRGRSGARLSIGLTLLLTAAGGACVAAVVLAGAHAAWLAVAVMAAAIVLLRRRERAVTHAARSLELENERLTAKSAHVLHELHASRARIATSRERERRRIERDLHDGAQQRLVALRIELELAEELVRCDPQRGAERLRRLERELDDALDELRALAHGVYPPLLADCGLPEALRAAAARCAIPVRVTAHDLGRYAPEVESAVYYCVLEALQNVLKHARNARHVVVTLDGGVAGELQLEVADDGPGCAPGTPVGAGITNMRDRLAALGGAVELSPAPGTGTLVRGWLPLDDRRRTVSSRA
jgi:signal transduction histidine kinase